MDPDPDPTPYMIPFFRDFRMQKIYFFIFFSHNLPTGTLSSVFKIFFLLKFCVKILFCKHYFSPLNTFMRKGKDPEPDPGGPKTSGFRIPNTGSAAAQNKIFTGQSKAVFNKYSCFFGYF
jgi:hypothetical protein